MKIGSELELLLEKVRGYKADLQQKDASEDGHPDRRAARP